MGRRLNRSCGWACRRSSSPNSSSSSWSSSYPSCRRETRKAATEAKIASWGRCLAKRLRRFSSRFRESAQCYARIISLEEEIEEDSRGNHSGNQKKEKDRAALENAPPKGYLPVYIGGMEFDPPRRVLVPVIFFNHPLFVELMQKAEKEFGFHHQGGITIPCPCSDFESVRTMVAASTAAGELQSLGRWRLPLYRRRQSQKA